MGNDCFCFKSRSSRPNGKNSRRLCPAFKSNVSHDEKDTTSLDDAIPNFEENLNQPLKR